ncbi:MAG: helix-turn-helix domain-containing protein [Christensenellales bacterium]|jgi:quercetin dioxygenase-like cupin family protein/DNA-binding XRE family transcriptional regulator
MSDNILEIARRVKELREICEVSAEELAKEVDLSVSEYLEYEEGKHDLPIGFLCKVADKLGVNVIELLTGSVPRLSVYAVTRQSRGPLVERNPEYRYQSLVHSFAGKKIEPFLVTVSEGKPGATIPLNSHTGHEFDYVVEGTLKFIIDDKEVILEKNDCIYLDSSHPHGMTAIGGDAKFIAVVLD